jgi:hypothetical protein
VVVLALFAAITLVLPAPAAAVTSLTLDPTSGPRGTTVDAIGSGYPANSPISILWDGTLIKSATPGSSRSFVIEFRVPRDATVGPHTVTMCVTSSGPTGCSSTDRDDATFTVVATATASPTPAPQATTGPTATPSGSGPTSSPNPTPVPTLPQPTFPLEAESPGPTPTRLPVAVVTPAPTPPNQVGAAQGEWPDLWIKAIEVTQGIQDLQNRMPLVAERRTYARVHVGVIGEQSWPNTYGALEARRDGQQVGWIWPENGPISAKLGAGSRVQVDDTLNFRLPQSWLHGEVTLTAFVYSYNVESVFLREPEWANNLEQAQVAFHPAHPLTVHLAPLHMHRSFHPDDVERIYDSDLDADLLPPGGSGTLRIVHGLYRFHALAHVNVDLLTTPITPIDHEDGHEFNPGDCQTTLVDWYPDGHIAIADWEPLMDDPATFVPDVGSSMEADNAKLAILDRVLEISFWGIVEDDGRIVVYGDWTGGGPQALPGTPVFVDGCRPVPSGMHEPNQALALYRVFYDWDAEEDLFVGMIHPSLPTGFGGGLSTNGTDAVSTRMTDGFSGTAAWSHSGAETLAHEAGHAAGLNHVPCRDADEDGVPDEKAGGPLDTSHPDALTFPVCTLADPDPEGYYGFDVYWSLWSLPGPTVISNDPGQPAPNKAWPWMAYQNPGWPDPYHFCRLLDFYGVPCDPSDLGIRWSEPDAPAGGPLTQPPDPDDAELPPGAVGLVGLSGSIDPGAQTGSVEGTFFIDTPTPSALRRFSGQYVVAEVVHRVVVLDAAGVELGSVPIQHQHLSHDDQATIDFELLVPAFPNAASYQIISAGRDVAHLDVSPNAPLVSWEPITQETDTLGRVKVKFSWTASDADRDRLTYTFLYAPDGEHWQVLAAGLRGRSHEVDLDTLPGGEMPTFQVIAFDGTRGTSALSQPIPADAGSGLKPGVAIKITPNSRFPSGFPVLLGAGAFDAEDRALPGEAIAWSSSIDGALGTGSELVVDDLSPGTHTITATVTDSDGLIDAQAFELVIDDSVVQPPADLAVETDVSSIFVAFAAGDDPGAAIAEAPVEPASPLPLAIGAVALVLVSAGLFVVRRRRMAAAAKRAAEPGAWRRRLR